MSENRSEAKAKQIGSKSEANRKQTTREKEGEIEKEIEIEIEIEKENKCYKEKTPNGVKKKAVP